MTNPMASDPMAMSGFAPEKFQARFEELQQQMAELQRTVEELTETAKSEDNLVEATVGARGELRELVLDPRIYRNTDAEALARTITETIWDATRAVTGKLAALAQPMMPAGSTIDVEAELMSVPPKDSDR